MPPAKHRWGLVILICYDWVMPLILLLVLAIILRLPHLGGSFWLDEAAQALESIRPLSQQHLIQADFQPPLIHYLTHFALYISHSEWWLRTVIALIPGLVTIGTLYSLAKKWYSPRVAFWSSLLLITSSFHIFFSQELRPYSLPAMFALLSWFFLDRLVSSKKPQLKKSLINLAGLTVTTIFGLYASYLYPFVTITQFIWILIFHRQHWQKFVTAGLLSALAFLPWLPSFLGQLQEGSKVREQLPGWDQVVSLTQGKAIFLTIGKFVYGLIRIDPSPLIFVSAIALLLIGLALIKDMWLAYRAKNTDLKKSWYQSLSLLVIFFTPLILAWLVSFFVPVLSPKRVLYLLPFFYLILSAPLDFLPKKMAPKVLVFTILIINLTTTFSYYFNPTLQHENWRDLHTRIVSQFGNRQALVVFSHPEAFAPWRWYDDGQFPSLATGTLSVSLIPNMREKFKVINDYQFILVFDYLRSLSDPDNLILKEIEAYGFKEIEAIDTPNIGFVRVFARPEAVLSSR